MPVGPSPGRSNGQKVPPESGKLPEGPDWHFDFVKRYNLTSQKPVCLYANSATVPKRILTGRTQCQQKQRHTTTGA